MIYPGATWDPGIAAGYQQGQVNTPLSVVAHYTVGVDSRALLRDQGLCQFLISRDGTVWQFAQANAVCYHAGNPYNWRGPGIEIEWYEPVDGPNVFTPAARTACAALVKWLSTTLGIPLNYRHGEPRVADWNGFIGHDGVVEDAEYHYDFWEQTDWDQMVAPVPPPGPPQPPTVQPESGDEMVTMCYNPARQTMVALAPGDDRRMYCAEQNTQGTWSPWKLTSEGVFLLPVNATVHQV